MQEGDCTRGTVTRRTRLVKSRRCRRVTVPIGTITTLMTLQYFRFAQVSGQKPIVTSRR
jgi:hypothetical protein